MLFSKGMDNGLRHFRGRRGVRRIVEVLEQNAHEEIVQAEARRLKVQLGT